MWVTLCVPPKGPPKPYGNDEGLMLMFGGLQWIPDTALWNLEGVSEYFNQFWPSFSICLLAHYVIVPPRSTDLTRCLDQLGHLIVDCESPGCKPK